MPELLLSVFRFVRLLFSGHQAVAIENVALRLQLAAFRRRAKRPVLTVLDRVFWTTLRSLWSGWRGTLLYLQPDTVVHWQRERFRRFWARLSKAPRRQPGRPPIDDELRRLIEQMVTANPLWRAPRIHSELKMLGILISERTVSRILRRLPRPPSQTWKTFFTITSVRWSRLTSSPCLSSSMKVLFVFFVLEHRRREILHFGVTNHPTAVWTSQQVVEAFDDQHCGPIPDSRPGQHLRRGGGSRIASLGIEQVLTAPRSPWQNPYAERLIGSIRLECLNHFVILSA